MIDDSNLSEKRRYLKDQLKIGNYSTLSDIILDGVGKAIGKITRKAKKPSFWHSGLVLFLIILVFGILFSSLFLRFHPYQETIIVFVIIMITTGFVSMFVGKIYIDKIFTEFRVQIIDKIQSVADLTDLEKWLAAVYDHKYQFLCGLVYALILPGAISVVFLNTEIGFIGVAPIISMLFPAFQVGLLMYYMLLHFVLPGRLSRYEYRLYLNDPRNSNTIGYLSNILTYGLFLFSFAMMISTISISYLWKFYPISISIFSLAIMWIPIVIIFAFNQSSLSKIVTQSKKRKISEIQAKIEKLEVEGDIANKETIEVINELMTFHDRIRDTKDSVLNTQTVINLFKSLFLPLISTVVSKISEILEWLN